MEEFIVEELEENNVAKKMFHINIATNILLFFIVLDVLTIFFISNISPYLPAWGEITIFLTGFLATIVSLVVVQRMLRNLEK